MGGTPLATALWPNLKFIVSIKMLALDMHEVVSTVARVFLSRRARRSAEGVGMGLLPIGVRISASTNSILGLVRKMYARQRACCM